MILLPLTGDIFIALESIKYGGALSSDSTAACESKGDQADKGE